jgi:O-antigen ligase
MLLISPTIQAAKMQSVSPWVLSFGLVFSVATQLRLPGLSLGLGEALLLLWMLITLPAAWNWRNPALTGVLALTIVGALLLSAGYFVINYPEGHIRPSAAHDTLAYMFCAALAINYVRLIDKCENLQPAMLLWAFSLSVLLALVLGFVAREWSGIDVMYYGIRWQHLSSNPNQFALLALPLPFLALHLLLRQPEKKKWLMPTLLGLLALFLGWYCKSDALSLAWVGGGVVAALALSKRPERIRPTASYSRFIAAMFVLLMVAGSSWQWRDVAGQVMIGTGTGTKATSASMGVSSNPIIADQNQVATRLHLWRNALAAIQYAPLTGMGPGSHSGFLNPFDGVEAHNTLLDWGTQAGVFGAVALLGYSTWMLWQVIRSRKFELVAMLLALYGFAMFHMMLRHPLFWILPLLALQLAQHADAGDSDAKTQERN